MKKKLIPLEYQEAIALMDWAKFHPICCYDLISIPNGGFRNPREAKSLQRQGVKSGVSDYFLSIPSTRVVGIDKLIVHGLWIELKRKDPKMSKISLLQKQWIERKIQQGYCAVIAYGAEQAILYIKKYLIGEF